MRLRWARVPHMGKVHQVPQLHSCGVAGTSPASPPLPQPWPTENTEVGHWCRQGKIWIKLWDYPVIRTRDALEVVVDKVLETADGALLDEPSAFGEDREKKRFIFACLDLVRGASPSIRILRICPVFVFLRGSQCKDSLRKSSLKQ